MFTAPLLAVTRKEEHSEGELRFRKHLVDLFLMIGERKRLYQSRESCHCCSCHIRKERSAPISLYPRLQGGAAFMSQLSSPVSDLSAWFILPSKTVTVWNL